MKHTLFLLSLLLTFLCCSVPWASGAAPPYPSPVAFHCNPVNPIPEGDPPPPLPPMATQDAETAEAIKTNVEEVVAQLVGKVARTGFATASYGSGATAIYGLLQCRADLNTTSCVACAMYAQEDLGNHCAKDGKARLWYEGCYLRYDTENFVGKLDPMTFYVTYNNGGTAANVTAFQGKVVQLMQKVTTMAVERAGKGGSFGKAKMKVSSINVSVYGMAQCTRDLAPSLCSWCLSVAVSKLEGCCVGKERGRVLFGSCSVHYETYRFF